MQTDFEFYIPIEKSGISIDPVTNDLIVDGPMSTTRRDLQGERVLEGAVASGLDTFIRLNMPIDWNHLSVKQPTPTEFEKHGAPVRFIMGEGMRVYDGPSPAGGLTKRLQSRLYFAKKATKDCLEHLNAGGKLYYSIGGSAERNGEDVTRTKITHVAVTPYPANPDCEIGLVGIHSLAKSMGIIEADSPDPAPPTPPTSAQDRVLSVLERLEDLAKTLTAGSGAGMGSTGGRALGREDLESDKHAKRCRCRGKCKCDPESTDGDEDSLDDSIRDTSPASDRRKRTKNMSKMLDNTTQNELAALETDPKLGPLAKGLGQLFEMMKGGKKPADLDPDDDNDGDGMDDDDEEAAYTSEHDDDGTKSKSRSMGKSQSYVAYEETMEDEAIDMDAEEFQKGLIESVERSMDKRFRRLEKTILGHVDKQMTDMRKSLEDAAQPATELLKTFDQLGMRPQRTGGVTGNYQSAESGKPQRSRMQTMDLIEKGIHAGVLQPTALTMFEIGADVPDEAILKSLE